MKFVAAYLLAVLGGKQNPSAEDVNNILAAAGATTDEEKVKMLLSKMEGKNAYEAIEEGKKLMATLGGAGAAGAAGAGAAGAAAGGNGEEGKEEEKKEEKKEEEEEEEGGFGLDLFG